MQKNQPNHLYSLIIASFLMCQVSCQTPGSDASSAEILPSVGTDMSSAEMSSAEMSLASGSMMPEISTDMDPSSSVVSPSMVFSNSVVVSSMEPSSSGVVSSMESSSSVVVSSMESSSSVVVSSMESSSSVVLPSMEPSISEVSSSTILSLSESSSVSSMVQATPSPTPVPVNCSDTVSICDANEICNSTSGMCECQDGYEMINETCNVINNFRPTFQPGSVFISQPQQIMLPSLVHTVSGSDDDLLGNLTYSLQNSTYSSYFTIDATQGALTVVRQLPVGNVTVYVVADDSLYISEPKNVTFDVFLVATPVLNISSTSVSIQETLGVNSTVVSLTCTAGDTRSTNISLSLGDDGESFRLEGSELVVNTSLDGNGGTEYTTTITCTNTEYEASYGIVTTQTKNVTIYVRNVATEWIQFSTMDYEFNLTENSPIGFTIFLPLDVRLFTRRMDVTNGTSLNSSSVNVTVVSANCLEFDPATWSVTVVRGIDREVQSMLIFVATATYGNLSAQTNITFDFLDENDNRPSLGKPVFHGITTDLQNSDASIITIGASDPDDGLNGLVRFSLDNSSLFVINATSGELKPAVSPLPLGLYVLTVTATDSDVSKPLSSTATLVITVNQDPSVTASFTRDAYYFEVFENASVGSVIGSVGRPQTNFVLSKPTYSIPFETPPIYFVIHPDTGTISTVEYLNREGVPRSFDIVVQVQVGLYNQTANVFINVTDINNHSPQFDKPFYYFELNCSTSSDVDGVMFTVSADDSDHGINEHITYSLSSAGNFTLNSATGVLTPIGCPPAGNYDLSVTAADSGSPRQSSSVTVRISVTPSIPSELTVGTDNEANFTIAENNDIGAVVGTILLPSLPESLRQQLQYTLVTGGDSDDFRVDDNSGELFTLASFDRESKPEYQVQVLVDLEGQVNTTAAVTIFVLDVNDNDPQFNETVYTAEVPATNIVTADIMILQVFTTDEDSESNVDYRIVPSGMPISFRVDSDGYVYFTGEALLPNIYAFRIAADNTQDNVVRTTEVDVVITSIPDPNDFFCLKDPFIFSLTEDAAAGSQVGMVKVQSMNTIPLNDLSYDVIDSDLFGITESGVLYTTLVMADFESGVILYSLNVSVSGLTLSGDTEAVNCSVDVIVRDTNDNRPNITNLPTTVNVSENAGGITLFHVSVSDPDSTTFLYSIVNGPLFFSLARLPADPSGLLYIGGIDRDLGHTQYDVIIMVSDGEHFDIGVLTVNIVDWNDNAPELIAPHYIAVAERCCFNESIASLIVNDIDEGVNAEIDLQLENFQDVFELRERELYLKREFDFENVPAYNLSIALTDRGTPKLSSTAVVTIEVKDLPDTPPIFGSGNASKLLYSVPIAPNISAGSEVIHLAVRDPDHDRVFFDITAVSGTADGNFVTSDFSIGSISGVIYKTRVGRFTADQNVNLTVRATDDSIYNVSTTTHVFIRIVPISLAFEYPKHSFTVNENTELFGSLCTNMLGILEVSRSREIDFSIVTVTPSSLQGKFETVSVYDSNADDLITGARVCLTMKEAILDREEVGSILLNVSAQSATGMAFTEVNITVGDLNDERPVITTDDATISIEENNSGEVTIAHVNVTDLDIGANAQYDLSITGVDASSVRLEGQDIILTAALNYEAKSQYEFVVVARDRGEPPMSYTLSFTIKITDINDPPELPNGTTYIAFAKESIFRGDGSSTVILTVPYSDEDSGSSLSRSLVPDYLATRDSATEVEISLSVDFDEKATADSFVLGTLKLIDDYQGMTTAQIYLVVFPVDSLFELKIETRRSASLFSMSETASMLKMALETSATGLRYHLYDVQPGDTENLLVRGVLYKAHSQQPGPVQSVPQYDYEFETSNRSSSLVAQSLAQISADLGVMVSLGASTAAPPTTTPTPPTAAPGDNTQLIITAIIAVVVVALVILAFIVILVVVVRRRKSPDKAKKSSNPRSDDNWGMRRKPVGEDNIQLQPRHQDDLSKLLHEDDELLGQNIQMPWWDPNYVKDDANATTLRATVDGDRRKAQMSRTPSEDANSDMDTYLSSYKADNSTIVTNLESPRPSEYDLIAEGKGNFSPSGRPTVTDVKWS